MSNVSRAEAVLRINTPSLSLDSPLQYWRGKKKPRGSLKDSVYVQLLLIFLMINAHLQIQAFIYFSTR